MRKVHILVALILIGILTTSCGPAMGNVLKSVEDRSLSGADFDYEMTEALPVEQTMNVSAEAVLTQRIVIRNADLTLVVSDPAEAAEKIGAMAEEMGGFIVSSNVYKTTFEGGGEGVKAQIVVRVPVEQLDEAMERMKADAIEVLNDFVSGQDVTKEYTDLQSYLRNREALEQQLLGFLRDAEDTESALQVFNELEEIRSDIDITKGQIQYYEEAARLSSISVRLEPDIAERELQIGPWKPVGTAKRAVEALLNTLKFIGNLLIVLIILIIPTAIVIAVIVWPIYKLYRRFRPKKAKAPLAEE